jgi:hypothetical protein
MFQLRKLCCGRQAWVSGLKSIQEEYLKLKAGLLSILLPLCREKAEVSKERKVPFETGLRTCDLSSANKDGLKYCFASKCLE